MARPAPRIVGRRNLQATQGLQIFWRRLRRREILVGIRGDLSEAAWVHKFLRLNLMRSIYVIKLLGRIWPQVYPSTKPTKKPPTAQCQTRSKKFLIALFAAIIGVFIGHRLTLTKDNRNRRREFRGTIRIVAGRIGAARSINLTSSIRSPFPLSEMPAPRLPMTLRGSSAKRFAGCIARYCGFQRATLRFRCPPPSPLAMSWLTESRNTSRQGDVG